MVVSWKEKQLLVLRTRIMLKLAAFYCVILYTITNILGHVVFDKVHQWKDNIVNKSVKNQICLARNVQNYCSYCIDNKAITVSDGITNGDSLECSFILQMGDTHLKVCFGKHVLIIEMLKTEQRWIFDTRIESALVFSDNTKEVVILHVDSSIFSFTGSHAAGQYHQAELGNITVDNEFLIPELTVVDDEASEKLETGDDNSWYRMARLAVNDIRIVEQNKEKRKVAKENLSSLVNLVKRKTDSHGDLHLLKQK